MKCTHFHISQATSTLDQLNWKTVFSVGKLMKWLCSQYTFFKCFSLGNEMHLIASSIGRVAILLGVMVLLLDPY